MPTFITKAAVFVFILVLIAVVSVTIVAEIAKFETETVYDVTAIIAQLEVFIQKAADKTIEQRVAIENWIAQTELDLSLVSTEMERLCDLADTTITPSTTPTP